MGFASPFPDVDIADVSVFGLLFTDIDQTDLAWVALIDAAGGTQTTYRELGVGVAGVQSLALEHLPGCRILGPVASRGRRAAQVQRARSIGRDRRAGLIDDFS